MTSPILGQSAEDDPFGYRTELLHARSQPELDNLSGDQPARAETHKAAFRLAVALGRCRLFGVRLEEYDEVLLPRIAVAAAQEFELQLDREWDKAAELGPRWDRIEDSIEGQLLCCSFLQARTDFWAGYVAVDESYQAALRTFDEKASDLRSLIRRLLAQLEALDTILQQQQDLLCLVADTERLHNWRRMLAEPYRSAPPWWIDGSLEAVLTKIREGSQMDRGRGTIHISLVSHAGMGSSQEVEVEIGCTLGRLLASRYPPQALSSCNYLVLVNGETVDWHHVLQSGNQVTVTPTKVQGA